jgi:DNA-binding CsgD family transcriptional regulator/tetratricopeptide (TPR) repeat protein
MSRSSVQIQSSAPAKKPVEQGNASHPDIRYINRGNVYVTAKWHDMASSAERVRRKRAVARKQGLCITCCRAKPERGFRVCDACKNSIKKHVKARRHFLRQQAESQQIIIAHERAGDKAREHYLHEDAVQHYKNALNFEAIAANDRSRISEKLALALLLSGNPHAASPLLDRALASYVNKPEEGEKAIEILLQQARQLWIDARTQAALPLLAQAIQIAEINNNSYLRKLTNCRMANYLIGLSRYKEAESFLRTVGEVGSSDGVAIEATWCTQRGILAAVSGNAADAFEYFNRAVNAAKEDPDVLNIISIWGVYGFWAGALGHVNFAKTCRERALFVARQFQIVWAIPHQCLEYARTLFLMGQNGTAYEYLLNALAYSSHVANTDTSFADVGIPLALFMKDEVTLEKCARLSAIEFAFRSGSPGWIASTVAAFAQLHVSRGREDEARKLLHRALEILRSVELMVVVWEFPIAVARFGSVTDIAEARNLIESEVVHPCPDIVCACLELFDAFAAQRQEKHADAQRHAMLAAQRFETLGWHGYADLARTVLPTGVKMPAIASNESKPFTDALSIFTAREQQIAELVLRGLTNRAIADALSIKERTVEAHMTSIMGHLGVRSRYELTYRMRTPQ